MRERPILFSAPMVRAILEGRKTQTRRIVKAKHLPWIENSLLNFLDGKWNQRPMPYGTRGDRLWVREAWQTVDPLEVPENRRGNRAPFTGSCGLRRIPWVAAYRADGDIFHPDDGAPIVWRPSIHMPRWASRITLEITDVRVERLHEISETDAMAEGVEPNCAQVDHARCLHSEWRDYLAGADDFPAFSAVDSFRSLWRSINDAGSWEANPWVWVIEFKRVSEVSDCL